MPFRPHIPAAGLVTVTLIATMCVQADERPTTFQQVTLTVTLVDDSTVTGIVDAETDDQFLALRSSARGILLRRFVPWNQIVEADPGRTLLTSGALKDRLKNVLVKKGARSLTDTNPSPTPDVQTIQIFGAAVPRTTSEAGRAVRSDANQNRVKSLEISATAANWDGDVAIDGIQVLVRPLNAVGEVVPVNGYVTLKLFGQKFLPVGSVRNNRQADVFSTLENWSRKVREQDFGYQGAVYQFPFRRRNPEFVHNLSSTGLTHASLSVPGQGVFRTSDSMTEIRDFSPYRDQHEQLTGQRFLPGENVPVPN
ncbi:MAG TPA: hypothetical protein EYG03_00555 [Planctomycetes bacterium]|nr:hypothetical protein [Planctomycetota bacterium]